MDDHLSIPQFSAGIIGSNGSPTRYTAAFRSWEMHDPQGERNICSQKRLHGMPGVGLGAFVFLRPQLVAAAIQLKSFPRLIANRTDA